MNWGNTSVFIETHTRTRPARDCGKCEEGQLRFCVMRGYRCSANLRLTYTCSVILTPNNIALWVTFTRPTASSLFTRLPERPSLKQLDFRRR